MKKIFGLLTLTFVLFGCGSKDPIDIDPMPSVGILDTYGISRNDVDDYAYIEDGNSNNTWFMGSKGEKKWFRLYNQLTKKLEKEWNLPNIPSFNAFSLPVKSPSGYVFFTRKVNNNVPKYDLYLVTIEGDQLKIIYTLNNNNWLNQDREPQHENQIPKIECYDGYFYLLNQEKNAPVFQDILISKNGDFVVKDVSRNSVDKSSYFIGLNNDKVWIGLFNEITKEKTKEWKTDESFNQNINDEYKNTFRVRSILIDNQHIIETSKGLAVVILYSEDVGSKDQSSFPSNILAGNFLLLNENDQTAYIGKSGYLSSISIRNEDKYDLKKWFDESLLFMLKKGGNSNYSMFVFSQEGKLLEDISSNIETSPQAPSDDNTVTPVSYTRAIEVRTYQKDVCLYDYKKKEYLWQTPVSKMVDIPENSAKQITLIDNKTEIWNYLISYTLQNGVKEQITFSVNINTGIVGE